MFKACAVLTLSAQFMSLPTQMCVCIDESSSEGGRGSGTNGEALTKPPNSLFGDSQWGARFVCGDSREAKTVYNVYKAWRLRFWLFPYGKWRAMQKLLGGKS